MKKRFITCFMLGLILLIISLVHADTRYEYRMNTSTDTVDNQFELLNKPIAQTFTVGTVGTNESFYINSVGVLIAYHDGAGSVPSVTASIRNVNASGYPTGADITSGTISPSFEDMGQGYKLIWFNITMTNKVLLQKGTTYALVLSESGDDSNNFMYTTGKSPRDYTGGYFYTTPQWVQYIPPSDMTFQVFGNLIPPTTPTTEVTTACQNVNNGLFGSISWITILIVCGFAVVVLAMLTSGLGESKERIYFKTEDLSMEKIVGYTISFMIVGLIMVIGIVIVSSIGGC